ncbi:MAG: MFS transporter [Candidatus Limnocylindrales bacterium]
MDPAATQADLEPSPLDHVGRSLAAVIIGTFTLRLSTGLTGALLVYYLAHFEDVGGERVGPMAIGLFAALFFATELVMSPILGVLSDRFGHHRLMELGPLFGIAAALITGSTVSLPLLAATRLLEGLSSAASIPSILGFIAMATAGDEGARGRASARFEGATLAGLGVGIVLAGILIGWFGRAAFFLNAVIYLVSFLIYRYGVTFREDLHALRVASHPGLRRYAEILLSSHVWLLAPTWIALNAALGMWTNQSLFQLTQRRAPEFANQYLMGHFQPTDISIGLAAGLLVFFAGLVFWGNRFKRYRRTSIIFFGIVGGLAVVAAVTVINHSEGVPEISRALPGVVVVGGLFVLAGATPAALGLLADVSEAYPQDRGAIMGLYSVFLAIGQIGGSLLGGEAARYAGIDGILIGTVLLLFIAVVPLARLREVEHLIGLPAGSPDQRPA